MNLKYRLDKFDTNPNLPCGMVFSFYISDFFNLNFVKDFSYMKAAFRP
jgi:hypothetical protein